MKCIVVFFVGSTTSNTGQDLSSLKVAALETRAIEEEVAAYFIYCSGFFVNMGNYKGFGDSKFIPNLPVDSLEKIVKVRILNC